MELNFFDWAYLGTFAGAVTAVTLLTQLTKGIPYINRIPTQLWSYVLAAGILLLSMAFGGEATGANAILCLFNAALVALASNGGYAAVKRIFTVKSDDEWGEENDSQV